MIQRIKSNKPTLRAFPKVQVCMETVSDCPIELPFPQPVGRGKVVDYNTRLCMYWDQATTQKFFITYIYGYFMRDPIAMHNHDFQFAALFYDHGSMIDIQDSEVRDANPLYVFCGRHFKIHCDYMAARNSPIVPSSGGPYVSFEPGTHAVSYVIDKSTNGELRYNTHWFRFHRNLTMELDKLTKGSIDALDEDLSKHGVTLPWKFNDERIRVRCEQSRSFAQKYGIENNGAGLIWNDPDKFVVVAKKVGIIK